METPPVLPPPIPAAARADSARATTLKLFAIGVLIVVLWLCLQLVDGVRQERMAFRDEARAGVAQSWGPEQFLAGPMLMVPLSGAGTSEARGAAPSTGFFLPAELEVEGELVPQTLRRGLFEVPVYEVKLRLHGRFRRDANDPSVDAALCDWSRARLNVALTQAGALRSAPVLLWNGAPVPMNFETNGPGGAEQLVAAIPLTALEWEVGAEFSMEMTVRGSRGFALALVGRQSRVRLHSHWADPSFGGAVPPLTRQISPEGFDARWENSSVGRGLPRSWTDLNACAVASRAAFERESLRVSLLQPVDAYRLVERALKYGLLFLVLVFAVFFLFEITGARPIHPLQYLMIGAALVLFFLGYLALGEFVANGLAYALAAAASTLLVTGYSASVLRSGTRCATVGASLGATYGYLYFILQLEDYALLAGTAALFGLLGVAMWATRKIDWYGRNAARTAP